jgi:translin
MASWDESIVELRDYVQSMHDTREKILAECRKLGQLAARSIRHVHRRQFEEAHQLLSQAKEIAVVCREMMKAQPELNPAYLHDTEKEMVEAAAVLAIVKNEPLPTRHELAAGTMAYLHGMGEAASEVRRFALDLMRAGNLEEAGRILETMELIYEELITFDFSDSLTNGLRRTCDALRAVIERTRSDLTLTVSQQSLVEELKRHRTL